MKKLTKLNLEKLGEEMEPISSEEKKSQFAGTYYYDENGGFIGQDGSSGDIRVIPQSMATSIGSMSCYYPYSQSLGSYGRSTQETVVRDIASRIGLSSIGFADYLDPSTGGSYNPSSGAITFNITGSAMTTSNFYEISLILYHEQVHANTTGGSSAYREYLAYNAVCNHPYFKYLDSGSQNFQREQRDYYHEQVYGY